MAILDLILNKQQLRLISAAPDLLKACLAGDSQGNGGPALLRAVADLVESFAPATANELRQKAGLEEAALIKATGVEVPDGNT